MADVTSILSFLYVSVSKFNCLSSSGLIGTLYSLNKSYTSTVFSMSLSKSVKLISNSSKQNIIFLASTKSLIGDEIILYFSDMYLHRYLSLEDSNTPLENKICHVMISSQRDSLNSSNNNMV